MLFRSVLCGFAAGLFLSKGPVGAVRLVHDGMMALRPFALAGQVGAIGLIWWNWSSLIRHAKFAPAVENAWLAARHRLTLWATVLVALGSVLWFQR